MSQVVSFQDYTPAERFDGNPWTDARIYEGPSSVGPWTLIDTIALVPVDTNPAAPQERSFTTENASDTPALWYRIVFVDGSGDVSQPTEAVQNVPGGSMADGICGEWITGADVADVCSALPGTDYSVYDSAALTASQVLYQLSGKQFSGECGPITVRPCVPDCGCWGFGVGPWYWSGWPGVWIGGGGNGVSAVQNCGGPCCGSLSRVKLYGYPVVSVSEVKINGDVIAADNYRLDGNKWLTYLNDSDGNRQRWPACQNLARPDTDEGTFSVTYSHGINPPLLGQQAAAQLACALARLGGECSLPPGTSQVDRLGIRVQIGKDKAGVPVSFAALPLVQLFLATYNPAGLRRRSAFWSPDVQKYAQRLG